MISSWKVVANFSKKKSRIITIFNIYAKKIKVWSFRSLQRTKSSLFMLFFRVFDLVTYFLPLFVMIRTGLFVPCWVNFDMKNCVKWVVILMNARDLMLIYSARIRKFLKFCTLLYTCMESGNKKSAKNPKQRPHRIRSG